MINRMEINELLNTMPVMEAVYGIVREATAAVAKAMNEYAERIYDPRWRIDGEDDITFDFASTLVTLVIDANPDEGRDSPPAAEVIGLLRDTGLLRRLGIGRVVVARRADDVEVSG